MGVQNPQFQKTTSDRDSISESNIGGKGIGPNGTANSSQMRKCMKGFNFKLDIDEIDRIIEEDDSMA